MKLDFNDVKENKIASEGSHQLSIVKAIEKRSVNGTNMLVLDMRDEEEGYVRDNVCLEGPGAFRMQQFLKAVELDADTAADMEAADFIGMSVTAEIIHEEYEGEARARVKKYMA